MHFYDTSLPNNLVVPLIASCAKWTIFGGMRDRPPTNYLVVITLSEYEQPIIGRIRQHGPMIKQIMEMISAKDTEPTIAFNSRTGETIGYLLRSGLHPIAIISQLESPGTNDPRNPKFHKSDKMSSPIQVKDRILVLELGSESASVRYGGLTNWLNQNLPQ